MPHKQPLDYLIVDQGLAGSLLAWSLLQRGHTCGGHRRTFFHFIGS